MSIGHLIGNELLRNYNHPFISRYVEQDDNLYAQLTVKETITFNALLRLPEEKSKKEKLAQVDRIISILGLSGVQNSMIEGAEKRGISGGERKRVSICCELVTDPRLIFLDEPTSGLDSFTALSICEALKEYVERGRETILMTIHQPRLNLLRLFNAIIILSQGKIVFFGSVDDAIEHFARLGYQCPERDNPADYFLDLATVSNKSPEEHEASQARVNVLVNAWHYDPITRPVDQHYRPSSHAYPVSAPEQFYLLLKRNFTIIMRDYITLIGELVTTLVIALLISFIFFQLSSNFGGIQGRIGLLFFITVNIVFSVVNPLLPLFVLDRSIMKKERYASTYRLSMAYLARFISLLPSRFFLYTIFAFLVYYITGLRTDGFQHFIIFWAVLIDVVFAAITLGLMIAASVPTVQLGQIIGTLVIVVFLLFAGNLANAGQVTWILKWIQYISIIFYTYEALIQNELAGRTFGGVTGDSYLTQYSLNQLPIVACAMAVLGLGVVFFCIGYIALRFSTKPKIKLSTKPALPPPIESSVSTNRTEAIPATAEHRIEEV